MLTTLRPLLTSQLLDRTFHPYKNPQLALFAVKLLYAESLTLLYYDQRVRKKGFDLQLMVCNLERAAPAAATVSAS
jgi:beta-xylosidase